MLDVNPGSTSSIKGFQVVAFYMEFPKCMIYWYIIITRSIDIIKTLNYSERSEWVCQYVNKQIYIWMNY